MCFLDSNGQDVSRDSLFQSYKTALQEKPKVIAGINSKRSLANGQLIRLWGLYIGLDYTELVRLSLGVNFLGEPLTDQIVSRNNGQSDTSTTSTNLGYWSLGSEFTVLRTEKWKLSVPMNLGLGSVEINTLNRGIASTEYFPTFPVEVGGAAVYYLYDWLGLKGGLGVRLALGKQSFQTFSAPFYKLGFGIYPTVLYRQLFKK